MPDLEMSRLLMDVAEQRMTELSDRLASGDIALIDWHIGMRQELRDAYAMQIVAAADGDKANVAASDWLKLGSQLRSQYGYLEDFARAVKDGTVSGDAIGSRSALYAKSAQTMYWKQATGGADLPTMPGEQACLGNCGCEWIDNGDGSWTWKRGKTDSCADCIHNEEIYNPYWPESMKEAA